MRILFSFLLLFSFSFSQTTFVTKSNISFFSSAPLEDISAVSNKLEGVVDFSSGEFFFRIPINTFIFPSSLMQKHFNEKYMETEKYALSTFSGSFSDTINPIQNQINTVNAKGVLSMHGVNQNVNINTTIKINNDNIKFISSFYVALEDFNIKKPKIVRLNIADTILVNVSGTLREQEQ